MIEFPRRGAIATMAGIAATALPTAAIAKRTITQNQFDCWLDLRGGLDGPAFWYSEGLVRPIADSGRPQCRMLGAETWVTPKNLRTPTKAVSFSRKIYFMLDLDKDEIIADAATGKPMRPSIFIYQVRTFTLADGAIGYAVESHGLGGITHGGATSTYTVNEIADQAHVNYGTYPVRPGPDGKLRSTSGEIYDYWDNGPRIKEMPARYQMSWVGTNLEGRIASMHGWRYPTFDDMPNGWLKNIVRAKAPEWIVPPMTMAEIEVLRGKVPYPVAGLGLQS